MKAAAAGANGGREAGVVSALAAAFGAGRVSRREYSATGKLLRTQVNEAVSTDLASRPRFVRLGSLVTTETHAAGTATRVVLSASSGVRIVELTAAEGTMTGLKMRAPSTLDEPVL